MQEDFHITTFEGHINPDGSITMVPKTRLAKVEIEDMPTIQEDRIKHVSEIIIGTSDSETEIIEKFSLQDIVTDEDELLSRLSDFNVERCPQCDYWVEAGELLTPDGEEAGCCLDCQLDNFEPIE